MNDDPWAATQPLAPLPHRRQRSCLPGCFILIVLMSCVALPTGIYLLAPMRTNILMLGLDRAPEGSYLSRTDTVILVTVIPLDPYVGMLSIPRDLWVTIPGVGENRINTAHFFAEGESPGGGPQAAIETVKFNFGVDVDYYMRIRFDGLKDIVEALGGLEIDLEHPMSGYDAGRHRLNGDQALAFVRDRQGTDDFFRMDRGQFFLKMILRQSVNPASWPRLPAMTLATWEAIDTNIPVWQLPRIGVALLRAGPEGIDNRVVSREMVNPFTTDQGAQVLAPDWTKINPVLLEMFGQ
jgi:polyisoprenyl-teichoic acid--peptidoglycan teichoic acid transferase